MRKRFIQFGLLSGLLLQLCPASDEIQFNRDIRPILSDKCYFCHGPDEENRKADIRFDVREAALEVFQSGEFMHRIRATDRDEIMPPPKSNLKLTEKEKDLLERWIADGASYEEHWSFTLLPESVDVPEVEQTNWPKQTLDRFVLAGIEKAGEHPTGEAEPLRWLRRVSFDLTGLPPSQEEIEQFLAEVSVDRGKAYQSAVDRYLASDSFGEQMATGWLDLARYADSYGYQSDKLNTQWPWRDWVVAAFNKNLHPIQPEGRKRLDFFS
ncbi:MAG: DUF1549 domain-containing protein [Verrucomicrobiales bacterium]|nr:DUF1549 domain-containing protein [Verrucomicrobiales bacterium]